MDSGLGIGMRFGWTFMNGPRMVNPDGVLVRISGRPPGWGNRIDFWLEDVKVNCSVMCMEMWPGDPKDDVDRFNGRFRAW